LTDNIPGPNTRAVLAKLAAFESRGVTYQTRDFPVVWESAHSARVVDADANPYIDFTAAFGVAGTGHSNASVVRAIGAQAASLMHAMGDVHPTAVRARLLEKLAQIAPGDLTKSYLCSTGSEAIEAALKTALLFSGKAGIVAFHGAYHGLSIGALEVCGLKRFRVPFESALAHRAVFFDFPRAGDSADALAQTLAAIRERLQQNDVGALIVEPILGRGGIVVPPANFLPALRRLCDQHRIVLIFDEVYTGFGRTGAMFAAQVEAVVPDIMCLGKALGNGFPISAAIAKPNIMDAWPPSAGEALHTSTYLGNPMGCAAALATIAEIERLHLPERARRLGITLGERLDKLRKLEVTVDVRGRGLMWGLELRDAPTAQALVKAALQKGLILLQAGEEGTVISITPPLTITEQELHRGSDILACVLEDAASG